jgi:dienelactone hydrolase
VLVLRSATVNVGGDEGLLIVVSLVERGRESRAGAVVRDVRFDGSAGGTVEAYLVAPTGRQKRGADPRPGALFAHWFDPEAPDGNRTQFLDEAAELANDGVVSLLPQGRFPWAVEPTDAHADVVNIELEIARLRRGLDTLVSEAGADPERLAVVGHDFGGMAAAVLAGIDRRARGYVLIAATPRWADWFLPFWAIAGDRFDYLRSLSALDPINHVGSAAPAELLFQFARTDYFIAPMTGREFHAAGSEPKEFRAYDADHHLAVPEARADRTAFLRRVLGVGA